MCGIAGIISLQACAEPHLPRRLALMNRLQRHRGPDGEARDFVRDIFSSRGALDRGMVDNRKALAALDGEQPFGRKIWGLLCLEIWQQAFHDRAHEFRNLSKEVAA
ncbi:MAG: hypothetical protein KJ726_05495 [Verrucomicrobia bacterium]|nr:hypothetical protein [Verrucomicrobiota bacterium]MBU1909483.1 hypothetical protein [Verrucomicrobiota bacterium]